MQSTFRYDVLSGTATDTYAGTGILNFQWQGVQGVTRIIEITAWDAPLDIRMTYDGTTWGPDIEVDQDDPPIQIPHAARAVQVKNHTPGSNSRYQITGFW